MKKTIFIIIFFVIYFSGYLFAVPANNNFANIKQPDGKTFKARLKGDEFYHWYEDEQGYTVIKDTDTHFWKYAIKHKQGHLEKSKYIVGKDIPVDIKKNLRDDNLLLNAIEQRKKVSLQKNSVSLQKTSALQKKAGASSSTSKIQNQKNLVILVEFSDKKFTFSPEEMNNLYNQTNYNSDGATGSVKDYLNEISYNNCDIEFIISTFVVRLNKGYAYYGENNSSGNDKHPREMVEEALEQLNQAHFNFAQADGDGDGYVDILTVIHSGCGEEYTGADSKDIWSHQWSIHNVYTSWDNKKLYHYITVPERRGTESSSVGIVRIGVIVHELLHIFDIPDLYDTTYTSKGLGSFCLMAHGLWNGDNGTTPAHPCAWVKNKLGFIQPKSLGKGKNSIGISAKEKTEFYKISPDTFSSKEYFMIENRQPYGFDKSLPGGTNTARRGLLIYHVDERKFDNDDSTHYLVALEEADAKTNNWAQFDLAQNRNEGTYTDYFRKTTVTTFNDDNTNSPDSKSYTAQKSGINIIDISVSGDTMFFWTEDYNEFVDNLDDDRGLIMVNTVMGFSKTKRELKMVDEATQQEIAKYFTLTASGAAEANDMYDIYNEYNQQGTVFNIPKNKMSLLSAVDANLVNKLNYDLRTSNKTQIKSVGIISFTDNAPVENNNISHGQNMRFTGTEVSNEILNYLQEYGYLMPKIDTMELNCEYDIIEVFENTNINNYKDYKFFPGAKTDTSADLSKIVCFPNPARNGKITITNLPAIADNLNIYIYTISGQMINSFSCDDTQVLGSGKRFLQWNCKTSSGNDIAQGIYIILIKNSNNKITKKIAVIR